MIRCLLAALTLLACSSANAQFTPGQVLTAQQLNAAFANTLSMSGGTLTGPLTVPSLSITGTLTVPSLTVTGPVNLSDVAITGGTISGLTTPLPVASGGTGSATASGTALDHITGFSGTGFLTRTGSGAYAFQSTTNGIALSNLAQAAGNTVLGNVTGSTANVAAFTIPGCSSANSAIQYTSGTGWTCGTTFALTGGTLAQFAATTSAQLAGVISDETGSGALVFGTGPAIGTPTISGGAINGASVGATTPNTGSFTTLAASSTVSGAGFSTYLASPPAIGGTTANTGRFTGLTATSGLTVSSGGLSVTGGATVDSLSTTSTITPSQTNGIVGTTTNNNANAGSIGEYVTSNSSGTSMTNNVGVSCASTTLTAGDWDVSGTISFVPAASTTIQGFDAGINTVNGALGGLGTSNNLIATFTTGITQITSTPVVRQSLSANTNIFLVGVASFGVSTMTCSGVIRARRVR